MSVYDDQRTEKPLIDQEEDAALKPNNPPLGPDKDEDKTGSLLDQESPLDNDDNSEDQSTEEESPESKEDWYKPNKSEGEDKPRKGKLSFLRSSNKKPKRGIKKARRKLLLAVAIGGLGVIIFISVFLAQLGSAKVIQLAESITAWNMARTARTLRISTAKALEENIEATTQSSSYIQNIKTRFSESRVAAELDKFNNKFRPGKVFKNLKSDISPVYTTVNGNKVFQGMSIDGTFIQKNDRKLFSPLANRSERIRFAAELDAVLDSKLHNSSSLVRNGVLKRMLGERGIKLRFWTKNGAKYQGLKQAAAERLQQYDTMENNLDEGGSCKVVKQVCDAAKEADEGVKTTVTNEVDNGTGNARTVADKASSAFADKVDDGLRTSALTTAVNTASLVYSIAVPVCLVYEGSMVNAKDTIDRNDRDLMQVYFNVRTIADQQKAGAAVTEAVAAANGKAGNTLNSIPLRRASGKNVDSTAETNALSQPESTSIGTYGLANIMFGEGAVTDIINKISEDVCPKITDIKTGLGFAAIEIALQAALAVGTGGGSTAGTAAAKEGVETAFTRIAKTIAFQGTRDVVRDLGVREGAKYLAFKAPVSRFVIKTGIFAGATIGTTTLAKMMVVKHSQAQNLGLETDEMYSTQADMGGNLYSRMVNREYYYGRPMTSEEVAQSTLSDRDYIAQENSQKSFTERYFALTNPMSLTSKAATSMAVLFSGNRSLFSRISTTVGSAFTQLGNLITLKSPVRLLAANTPSGAGEYNIVQFGWTDDELNIIRSNPTYAPMENRLIVEEDSRVPDIEEKYSRCFTSSMGELLSEGKIEREDSGKVISDTSDINDCSPKNLSINNPTYGDLVFRWRLTKLNDATYDHLLEIQEPTVSAPVAPEEESQ